MTALPAGDGLEQFGTPLPRWFWLLPALAVLAWWPLDPFWASDDFLALHYAQDPARALADFRGWQYGATDIWFFYRPLITLSFCLDALVAGGAPFWSHLSNVLAHGISALLVGLLWRRLLDDWFAFAAALLWALAPSHVGTIAWAVGRVDGHTTVWCLLCIWSFVRACEGRRAASALSVGACALALLSKELALALPGLVLLLGFAYRGGARWGRARARPVRRAASALSVGACALALLSKELALALPGLVLLLGFAYRAGPGVRARARTALRRGWPHVLLLVAYLLLRVLVLGRFGGYLETTWAAAPMAQGFTTIVLDLLNPLRWATPALPADAGALTPWLPWLGWLPVLAVLALGRFHRRLPAVAVPALLFLLASVPVAGFFAGADNHHNLRYFYFPLAALTGLLVAGGRLPTALLFLAWVPALVGVRAEQWQADRQSASLHRQLRQQLGDGLPGPWFVAGLPPASRNGTAIQFHFGIDRLLEPPFGPGGTRLFAHRPILPVPGAIVLHDEEALPIAPPLGTTLLFKGPELLISVPRQLLPSLPLAIDGASGLDLDLSAARMQQLKDQRLVVRIRTPGVRTEALRVTFFTGTGYLCCVVPSDAGPGGDGGIDLLRFFETAKWATGGDFYLLRGLEVPSTIDLEPSFPVLVEGGRIAAGAFIATHRARELALFRFDRGFPAFVRRALGLER